MAKTAEMVVCATPTPGKQPKRIDKWKYDRLRKEILRILPARGEGTAFRDLPALVERNLTPDERARVGSIMWYVTTVKLDMETKGEIERVADVTPQRLRRCTSKKP